MADFPYEDYYSDTEKGEPYLIGRYWSYERGYYELWSNDPKFGPAPAPAGPATAPPPPAAPLDLSALAGATYGRRMPLFAGGLARIGGAIVFGPFPPNAATGTISTHADFGISFGVPANVTGTRTLFEIAFDSKVAWFSTGGTTNIAAGTFAAEPFTARFYQGTLTQTVDPMETERYGSGSVAYRPQMMIFFEGLPLAPFGGKIPYVAALIGDNTGGATPSDGINVGEALERVAHSLWAGYTTATFDTEGIVDVVDALLLDQDISVVDLCRNITMGLPHLDLLQNDKLRLVDRGDLVGPDLTLTLDDLIDQEAIVGFARKPVSEQPREFELITIDPDADYTWIPAKAQRPRDPVVVSGAIGKDTLTLPLVMDASTRTSLAYYAQYYKENARRLVKFKTTSYGYDLEPGDRVALSGLSEYLGGGIDDEIFKITQTVHGSNMMVDCSAEAILRCAFSIGGSVYFWTCNVWGGTATTSLTFTGVTLDAPDANRRVIVGITIRPPGIGRTFTSVTIGGVAATAGAVASNTTTGAIAAVYHATVPTGTTGDIVITMSDTFTQASIHVYRRYSAAFAGHDSATAQAVTADPIAVQLDVPAAGLLVAAGIARSGDTFVFQGVTADCVFVNPDTTGQKGAGSYSPASAETNRTVTLDPSSFDAVALAAASYSF